LSTQGKRKAASRRGNWQLATVDVISHYRSFMVAISVLPPMTTEENLKVIRNWEV
jgi:hypothetical protein